MFGLQHDVEELEADRDKLLYEIENHENHLQQLKGNKIFLNIFRTFE